MSFLEDLLMDIIERTFPQFLGIAIGSLVAILIVILIVEILAMALLIRIAFWIKKIETSFAICIGTSFYFFLIQWLSFIPYVGIVLVFILDIWVLKRRHLIDFWDAIIVYILAIIAPVGIVLLIMYFSGTYAINFPFFN